MAINGKTWILWGVLLLLFQFDSSSALATTDVGRRRFIRYSPLSSTTSWTTRDPYHLNIGQHTKRTHHSLSMMMMDSSSSQDSTKSAEISSTTSSSLDPLLIQAALALRRTSWLSWWTQVILTTVSSVTLLFAKGVLETRPITQRTFLPGAFIFAGTGIGLSIVSILWTWGGARLSRRILQSRRLRSKTNTTTSVVEANSSLDSFIQVAQSLRKVIRVGTYLNLLGMLITLIGAEQIIGLLAARVLTTASTATLGVVSSTAQVLQPLDILIVQANTNTLLSHFISLVCTLYLTNSVHSLDPPSTEEE